MPRITSIIFTILFCAIIGGTVTACAQQGNKVATIDTANITVAVSILPLQELAQAVIGPSAKITLVTPRNTEPHEYELTSKDIGAMTSASLIIAVGDSFEPWLQKISNVTRAPVLRLASEIPEAAKNPHFWVNPHTVIPAIESIKKAITALRSERAAAFEDAAQEAKKIYTALEDRYRKTFRTCKKRTIVVSHNAFQTLGDEYGIEIISIAGADPEAEPDARHIADIIARMKKDHIRTIFKEPLLVQKYVRLIAAQTGATIQALDPIEGIGESSGIKTLPQSLEENLKALSQALNCAYNAP